MSKIPYSAAVAIKGPIPEDVDKNAWKRFSDSAGVVPGPEPKRSKAEQAEYDALCKEMGIGKYYKPKKAPAKHKK